MAVLSMPRGRDYTDSAAELLVTGPQIGFWRGVIVYIERGLS